MKRTTPLDIIAVLALAASTIFTVSHARADVSLSAVRAGSVVCESPAFLAEYEAGFTANASNHCTVLDSTEFFHVTTGWSVAAGYDSSITVILFDGMEFYTKSENIE